MIRRASLAIIALFRMVMNALLWLASLKPALRESPPGSYERTPLSAAQLQSQISLLP